MSVFRMKDAWAARKDRRARQNQQLADADAAERMSWVQRGIPEQRDPEWTDKLREPGTWEAS